MAAPAARRHRESCAYGWHGAFKRSWPGGSWLAGWRRATAAHGWLGNGWRAENESAAGGWRCLKAAKTAQR